MKRHRDACAACGGGGGGGGGAGGDAGGQLPYVGSVGGIAIALRCGYGGVGTLPPRPDALRNPLTAR